jgi:hypothetical protein
LDTVRAFPVPIPARWFDRKVIDEFVLELVIVGGEVVSLYYNCVMVKAAVDTSTASLRAYRQRNCVISTQI